MRPFLIAFLVGALCLGSVANAEPMKVGNIDADPEIQGHFDRIGEYAKLEQYAEPCGFQFAVPSQVLVQDLQGALFWRGATKDQVDIVITMVVSAAVEVQERYQRQAEQDRAGGTLKSACDRLREQNAESGLLIN